MIYLHIQYPKRRKETLSMEFAFTPEQAELRAQVRALCSRFPDAYWRETDQARAYPEEFVRTLTEAGYLSALIPKEYGGLGLGVTEASIVLEEINRSGGSSAACHAQMYIREALMLQRKEEPQRSSL